MSVPDQSFLKACDFITQLCHIIEAYEEETGTVYESDQETSYSSDFRKRAMGFALEFRTPLSALTKIRLVVSNDKDI